MIKNIIPLFLLMTIFAVSCNNEKEQKSQGIKRYEVSLFSIDTNSFENGLKKIYPDYKVFLGEEMPDKDGINQLKSFVTDPLIRETYEYSIQQYPDLEWLNQGFNEAFNLLKKEYPQFMAPQVYTYISGFDIQMPIKYSDSALIIGLDLYLGAEFETYKVMGYPLYITNRLTREQILPDAFKEIAWAQLPEIQATTLLDAMIEEGKLIYFSEVVLQKSKKEDLLKYTTEQLNWVISNEQNLWSFIIDNQLLYSSDPKAITMFITDGPFTSGFGEESPSRTGHWLGWQIVRSYMQNNDVTLQDLLKETDSQKILQQSGYKPAKV